MQIIIPGNPKSWKRPGKKKGGGRYDASSGDKKEVSRFLLGHKPDAPIEGPVRVDIHAYFKMPKSWSDKKKAEHESKPRIKTPDNDNIEKLYWDCLSGMFIKDDKQIVRNYTAKYYSQKPCVVLKIVSLNDN